MSARCSVPRPLVSTREYSEILTKHRRQLVGVIEDTSNNPTSLAVTRKLSQSMRGVMLRMNSGWNSSSCSSSSASWKCNGNEAEDVLQSLTAQVTKLAVITFILTRCSLQNRFTSCGNLRYIRGLEDSFILKDVWEFQVQIKEIPYLSISIM